MIKCAPAHTEGLTQGCVMPFFEMTSFRVKGRHVEKQKCYYLVTLEIVLNEKW